MQVPFALRAERPVALALGAILDKPFPRKLLAIPALVPFSIVSMALLVGAAGHTWNVHGDLGAVYSLVLVTSIFALPIEGYALAIALPRLRRIPGDRTFANLIATAVAILFVAVFAFYAIVITRAEP